MSQHLAGKIALVTGASGGIGRAIAVRLAAAGADIIVHYAHGQARAEETARLIAEGGGKARLLQADLSDLSAVPRVVDACQSGLDILINNAGIARGHTLAATTHEEFEAVFATNVRGTFFLTQGLLPHISDGGAIINISSMVSVVAYPTTISYSMSKAAINAFSRSLAADLGPRKIRVNAVAPGATDSDFLSSIKDNAAVLAHINAVTALGRLGAPEEIASVVEFLVSPAGAWVTGQVIQASGGMHL
ncbi:MAG: SDR family oxidoreductase [Caulobacterales bacterium]